LHFIALSVAPDGPRLPNGSQRLTFSRRRLSSSRRLGSSRYDKYPLFQAVGGEIMIGIDKSPPPFA